jgi:hypothetical protein
LNQPVTMKQVRAKMLARFCVLAGRVLILFSAVLLAITPMTAHFWTFDRFLRGGQDFEMGLLSVLAVLCLVLLLADSFRETISLLIALREWLSIRYRPEYSVRPQQASWFRQAVWIASGPGSYMGSFPLPLLI